MDDHVAIGGRYFDLQDTTFRLERTSGGTRLGIVAHYRLTSSINFYAVPMAALLGRDFIDTILGLYKLRSERTMRSPAAEVRESLAAWRRSGPGTMRPGPSEGYAKTSRGTMETPYRKRPGLVV
jgi:hypothetical protein